MGLLGDIGRSGGVGQLGNNLLSGALQTGQYMQQADMAEMNKKLIEAKLAEQERLNRPTLLSELVGKGTEAGKPNSMKLFADAAKASGAKKIILPDGTEDYTITQADIPTIQKFMALQKDLHPQIMWAQYQDNSQAIPELQKQLPKAKTPAEKTALEQQIEKMKIENASILKEFGKEGEADKPFTLGKGQTRFSASGDEIASVSPEEEQWSEPKPMVLDGKTVMVQKNEKTGQLKSVAQGATPAVQINFEKDVIKQTIKDLPKLKEKAKTSASGIQRIDKMLGLIEQGAGGRLGQIKGWLAPSLEVVGIKSKGLSDAQLYQTLARTLGGSMRMEIIGPGQVSDYENRLMAAVSAGGGTATEAAKELLQYYRGIAEQNINDYNNSASVLSEASPTAAKVHKPIQSAPPQEKKRLRYNPATGQLE